MTSIYTIPLKPRAQQMQVDIAGKQFYLRLLYNDATSGTGGWTLDMADATGTILLAGTPLVTGVNSLEPYEYLGVGAQLFVSTPGAPERVPGYADLGVNSQLCWTTDLSYRGYAPRVVVVNSSTPVVFGVLTDDDGQRLTDDTHNAITRLS